MLVKYNRQAAVQYAETWWNSYNPNFPIFDVDCTNYISQCLLAGGAPMRGQPNRQKGWWLGNNTWSLSWSTPHSLRWYLAGSTIGLQAKQVNSAQELILGDLIFYDFEGDGRWDHSTIVTRIQDGVPYVNAHTNNSRNRYWDYHDSYAYTSNTKYIFFHVKDDF
ncbi:MULTISPECIES: amidase domain-containing protein [Psychrobacillus]|uniref:Amidase domain-containing protein n=1 Tax=Psychrobacillus faecigallinarum TaxID=2762235 RepID=A0ABR8R8E5_9BACI|nr:amidase domain-containing protein [Psychrobacillus faecigallinarum]MBD7944064.1 amidase domain-containing protein [Psychrobacillus faecigallinarum]QEY22965.1 amidase [Psychrobacillus sp. AK 1817]QGM32649.1 amidase [Bacillus sp. N3536]